MPTNPKEIRLNYRQLYILPTRRGLGFILLVALLLLIAFIYNNNLVYLLSFLLASIFLITLLLTVQSLAGLIVSKQSSPAIFAGDYAAGLLLIDNPDPQIRYSIIVGLDKEHSQVIDLGAQKKTHIRLTEKVTQRGWYLLPKPTISSCFPFGLFRTWTQLNLEWQVLVYPKPSQQNCPFPENTNSRLERQGSAAKGQDDFYGLQNYQAGDNIRAIHWRTFAKGQGLYTKQYSGAQSTEIWLDYEQTLGADKEQRLSQMCRWVLDANQLEITYGLTLADLQIEPAQGEAHLQTCLEALALF